MVTSLQLLAEKLLVLKNSGDSRLLPQVWKSRLRYAKLRRDLSTGTYTHISEQLY
jgi:hypothetical protein